MWNVSPGQHLRQEFNLDALSRKDSHRNPPRTAPLKPAMSNLLGIPTASSACLRNCSFVHGNWNSVCFICVLLSWACPQPWEGHPGPLRVIHLCQEPFHWALCVLWNIWGILRHFRILKPFFPSCWCHLLLDLGSNRGRFPRRSWGVLPAPEHRARPLLCHFEGSHRAAAQVTLVHPQKAKHPLGQSLECCLGLRNAVKSSRWEKNNPEKHHWWDVCV